MEKAEAYLNEKHLQQNELDKFRVSVKVYKDSLYVGSYGEYFEAIDEREAMMKAVCYFAKECKVQADDIFIADIEEVAGEIQSEFAYH